MSRKSPKTELDRFLETAKQVVTTPKKAVDEKIKQQKEANKKKRSGSS